MSGAAVAQAAGRRAAVVAALVAVQVLFGVHYLAAKILLEQVPPRSWAVIRVVGGAAVLWGLVLATRRRLPSRPGDVLQLALYSVLGVVLNQWLFVEGLSRTTPIHSALINTSIPVLTLAFAVALRRERLSRRKLAALALALSGVLLVIRPDPRVLGDLRTVGDLLTLANATSFSLFLVLSKRVLARCDPLAAAAVLFGFGAVGLGLVGGGSVARFDPSRVDPVVWAIAAFIIVGPTALTYVLNYWALARVDSSVVALFVYLQPLIAGVLSWTVRGERPGVPTLVGGGLVCAGVWLAVRSGRTGRGP